MTPGPSQPLTPYILGIGLPGSYHNTI